ncbi:class I SAM-dependent methyltransferase [Microvirga terricola]|uniref:Methyltransferase domain-containing protein n=1 Tax=Microvirga terricola TaxID=2719797 RepID=A0ABX0VBD9_9HYPH|nr:methyltransferase domain-containing protein [Microvirga terricola]NIX77177.1 methyltransferase domain-containing protein [Microvirga terricola]
MSVTDVTFAGSIPALYEKYLGPLLFEPYAEDLAARLAAIAPEKVLETAAGTGIVTRAMDKALPPSVTIVATDLNPAMLDLAAKRLNSPRVTWRQADAQNLPFEDATFDAVACQFGVMFFPDKIAAHREVRRVLKPGGVFVFTVWDRLDANPVSKAVADAIAGLLPDNPPRFVERVPFGYSDPDRIRGDMGEAGFEDIKIEAVEKVTYAPSPQDLATGLCQGTPLRNELEARAPGRLDEITEKTAEALAARFGSSAIENRMRAIVVTARR